MRLYDQGLAPLLLLVGDKPSDWNNMIRRHCPECSLDTRQHFMINGSVSTMTDASLSREFATKRNLRSLLVVTDPYHSLRADLVFSREFKGSGIDVLVISSGDFGSFRQPHEQWWQDQRTLEYVWVEFGKILYWKALGAR